MAKNKNITKLLCPVCGTEFYINKQTEVKCLCLSKLIVLKNGKEKQLVKIEDAPAIRKSLQVKCRDCGNFSPKEQGMGDCLDLERMKRNVNGECITICKRFRKI